MTPEQLVKNEVFLSVSTLVAVIAKMPMVSPGKELIHTARELGQGVPDWKEAARASGWRWNDEQKAFLLNDKGNGLVYDDKAAIPFAMPSGYQTYWKYLCEQRRIEPHMWEVYEHWAVSERLAEELKAHGERTALFGELYVWARTSTGQNVDVDDVIHDICAEHNATVAAQNAPSTGRPE